MGSLQKKTCTFLLQENNVWIIKMKHYSLKVYMKVLTKTLEGKGYQAVSISEIRIVSSLVHWEPENCEIGRRL